MPELKRQVSGEENKFQLALATKLIKDASLEEIKEQLRFVMVKVGLRAANWPNDLEKVILHQHIVENFGGHRVDEIRLAFDLAISGKLGIDDVKCYENFSCAYFSTIMNGYRNWAAETYRQIKVEKPPEQRIFTQEELDDGAREDAQRQYRSYLRGLELKGLEMNKPILEKDGLIGAEEKVIDFFKRRAENGFENIYTRQ